MAGESKKTTDHNEIKKWAEERGGVPTVVKGTKDTGEGVGLLRIDFKGDGEGKEDSLDPVSWEEFFKTFDKKNLEFLYQDKMANGQESRFFKFVSKGGD